jgi:hypothetical protein
LLAPGRAYRKKRLGDIRQSVCFFAATVSLLPLLASRQFVRTFRPPSSSSTSIDDRHIWQAHVMERRGCRYVPEESTHHITHIHISTALGSFSFLFASLPDLDHYCSIGTWFANERIGEASEHQRCCLLRGTILAPRGFGLLRGIQRDTQTYLEQH